MSWADINSIINYETCSNSFIPNWYDINTKKIIADTNEKKAALYLNYIHRFVDKKKNDLAVNDDYDKIWNNYKNKRWMNVSNKKWRDELNYLNGIITKNEIIRSVNSFDGNSANFEDNISHEFLQKGLNELLSSLFLIYNDMFIVISDSIIKFEDNYISTERQ